eukprot:TRINITY_DN65818_c5_g1_i1.p1 TRINITY_DN65818_c5_g1~~TRINITY_DN65818_c5_g1_i1.p1  ORF type:complete len:473 (+),score=248.84 TRINITY_DN65818_c5_g1_i1:321-1739(+)
MFAFHFNNNNNNPTMADDDSASPNMFKYKYKNMATTDKRHSMSGKSATAIAADDEDDQDQSDEELEPSGTSSSSSSSSSLMDCQADDVEDGDEDDDDDDGTDNSMTDRRSSCSSSMASTDDDDDDSNDDSNDDSTDNEHPIMDVTRVDTSPMHIASNGRMKPSHPIMDRVLRELAADVDTACRTVSPHDTDAWFYAMQTAHWRFSDVVAPKWQDCDPPMPRLRLKTFAQYMVERLSRLRVVLNHRSGGDDDEHKYNNNYNCTNNKVTDFDLAFADWRDRLVTRPVFGVICINKQRTKVLMVRGFGRAAAWSFPKGKLEPNETGIECALRELREETGLHLPPSAVDPTLLWTTKTKVQLANGPRGSNRVADKAISVFLVPNVPETDVSINRQSGGQASHSPREIAEAAWMPIDQLPAQFSNTYSRSKMRFWCVRPFVSRLNAWLHSNHMRFARCHNNNNNNNNNYHRARFQRY